MNDTTTLDLEKTAYRPGDTIRGTVGWRGAEPPATLCLRLFWYTEGRGEQDVGIAHELTVDPPAAGEQRSFELTAPERPVSFRGELIALHWALELLIGIDPDAPDQVVRQVVVIAPDGQPLSVADRDRPPGA